MAVKYSEFIDSLISTNGHMQLSKTFQWFNQNLDFSVNWFFLLIYYFIKYIINIFIFTFILLLNYLFILHFYYILIIRFSSIHKPPQLLHETKFGVLVVDKDR